MLFLEQIPKEPLNLVRNKAVNLFRKPCLYIFFKPLLRLPEALYQNVLTAYLGFPPPDFGSSDYFPLIPWCFLFLTGFYLHGLCGKQILAVRWKGIAPLNLIGRHALGIYMLHQPVIYGLLLAWNTWLRPLF